MPKPKLSSVQWIENAFDDMSVAQQKLVLVTLQTLHRLKVRQAERETADEDAGQDSLLTNGAVINSGAFDVEVRA